MTTPQRPNILFIVADDLGFADLGCYGGRDADFGKVSPVLDGLAARGSRFTDGYANSPVCSPTRFALITGRYQYRLRGAAEEPISSRSKGSTTLGLPPEHPTVPSLLKDAGYRTALIGKWHLGWEPRFQPNAHGFEEFWGFLGGWVDFHSHMGAYGKHDLWHNRQPVTSNRYITDEITDRAAAFIEKHQREPFFVE
ncbi:MAG TPA: sulfatase-like hydrolase/transferase, partial [Ramlibacter sp.]|nr:sulfatase-like hydrolase/transferase [Ramlibacter sp.]